MNNALSQHLRPFSFDIDDAVSRKAAQRDVDVDPATVAQARMARRIVSYLDDSAAALPHDVSERLRFARERALERARLARVAAASASVSVTSGGAAVMKAGSERQGQPWWLRLVAVVPVVALVAGLAVIQHQHAAEQIKAAADIDAALLSDDLPPAAYADPAFAEYLKAPRD